MNAEVWNPTQIEERIRDVSGRIADGVTVCNTRYTKFLEADHALDVAFAKAYMAHQGPQTEKKYAAELATQDERAKRDLADASYRFADRNAKALESELRALQSVGASIRSMYSVAGRGES